MKGTRRSGISRRIRAVLASTLVIGALQVAAPVTFAASTPPATGCNWGDVWFGIDTVSKPYKITHRVVVSLAPGTEYNQTHTLGTVSTITGTVTGSISSTVEANAVISKVGATTSLTLQVSGSSTESSSVSFGWKLTNNTNVQRRYVVFTAPHRVSGTFTKWQCDRWERWFKVGTGTYVSWDYEMRGTALCGYTYANNSAERLAQAFCP